MNHLFRAFVATLLMVCLSCSGNPTTVRHAVGRPGQAFIPDETMERFQVCGEAIQEGVKPGSIQVDAHIDVDRDGDVFKATTAGEPNEQFGMCIRDALRNMHVESALIEEAKRRARSSNESSGPNVSTLAQRTQLGQVVEVVTITVVVVVYVEVLVVVSTVAVAIGVVATVHLAAAAVEAAVGNANAPADTAGPVRKPHQPNAQKWLDNGGSIDQKADGSITYTRSDGVAVTYNNEGFPDFTPYRHPTVKDVQIEFTGIRYKDFSAADKAAGITEKKRTDEKYTWHHHEDGKTMQLIKQDVHAEFFHTGGMARVRREYGKCE